MGGEREKEGDWQPYIAEILIKIRKFEKKTAYLLKYTVL